MIKSIYSIIFCADEWNKTQYNIIVVCYDDDEHRREKYNIIIWLRVCVSVYVFSNKLQEFVLLCITMTSKSYGLPLTNGGQKFKSL